MKLYFSPGACSLSPHIALREAGLPFELVRVDLRAKKTADGADYLAINPKGYVPALELDDGQLLTEGAIVVQYIADQNPDSRLAPRQGTIERLRLAEWLHFIATELQKGSSPIKHPKASDELKEAFKAKLELRLSFLAKSLERKTFLLGESLSVADGYAYYALRSLLKSDAGLLQRHPVLNGYFERLAARPAVRAALEAEGLSS
jgi:glutathione S-transferase